MSHSADAGPILPTRAELPLFPLNTVLFPGGPLSLRIFEARYLDLVRRCMRDQSAFGVVLIVAGAEAGGDITRTALIGTSARIVDFNQLPDGLLGIACIGERKFRLLRRWQQGDGLHLGEIEWLPEEPVIALPPEHRSLGELIRTVLPDLGELYNTIPKHFDNASWVGFRLAEMLPLNLEDRQECLAMDAPVARLERLSPLIRSAGEQ